MLTPVPATPPSSQKKSPVPSPMFSRRQAEQQLGFAPRPQTRRGPRGRKDSCKAPQQAWAARTASPSSDSDECLDRAEIKRRARRTPCSTKKRRPFASPEELVLVDTPSSETAASPARAVDASPALGPRPSPALGPRRRRDDAAAADAAPASPALAPAAGAGRGGRHSRAGGPARGRREPVGRRRRGRPARAAAEARAPPAHARRLPALFYRRASTTHGGAAHAGLRGPAAGGGGGAAREAARAAGGRSLPALTQFPCAALLPVFA